MYIEFSFLSYPSYKDYLAQRFSKENIEIAIARNVREAIGSVEAIYADTAGRICADRSEFQSRPDADDETLEVVSFSVTCIGDALDTACSNVVNGFQALFVKIDELDPSIGHLRLSDGGGIEVGRTPAQMWAFNQYEIAKDAARRKQFARALKAVGMAINGSGPNTGLDTDFRFHYLRGVLLAGIPGEPDTAALVDLRAAQQAFVLASRYARRDHPSESAQALVGAGKAAYADNRVGDAVSFCQEALETDPHCGEAHYQMARLAAHAKDDIALQDFLSAAFDIHWSFAMRAAADVQFRDQLDLVESSARKTARQVAQSIEPNLVSVMADWDYLRQHSVEEYPIERAEDYPAVVSLFSSVKDSVGKGGLKNFVDARGDIRALNQRLVDLARSYVTELEAEEEAIVRGEAGPRGDPKIMVVGLATTISLLMFLWAFIAFRPEGILPTVIYAALSLLALVCGWFLLLYAFAVYFGRSEEKREGRRVEQKRTSLRQKALDISRKFAGEPPQEEVPAATA